MPNKYLGATIWFVNQVVSFVHEARAEFVKVTWPKRDETVRLTIVVVAVSIMVGAFVGGLDFFFTNIMNWLLGR